MNRNIEPKSKCEAPVEWRDGKVKKGGGGSLPCVEHFFWLEFWVLFFQWKKNKVEFNQSPPILNLDSHTLCIFSIQFIPMFWTSCVKSLKQILFVFRKCFLSCGKSSLDHWDFAYLNFQTTKLFFLYDWPYPSNAVCQPD